MILKKLRENRVFCLNFIFGTIFGPPDLLNLDKFYQNLACYKEETRAEFLNVN